MSLISQVKEKIVQYIDVYIKLAKISFIEGSANVLSYFMYFLICLFLLFCIVLFSGFGLVEIFNAIGFTKLSSISLTLGVYALVLLLLLLLRRKITRFFSGGFIKMMTEGNGKDKTDEDDDYTQNT